MYSNLEPQPGEFPPVSHEEWREAVERDLEVSDGDARLVTRTHEGIDVRPLYTAEDYSGANDPAGFPGLPPFTRGSLPTGASRKGWKICQEFDDPTGVDGKSIRSALDRGVRYLWLRFNKAVRLGNDADDPAAQDQLSDGCPLISARDLSEVVKMAAQGDASVALDAGANALPVAGAFIAATRDQGVPLEPVSGSFCFDPLGALVADGVLPSSLETTFQQMVDLAQWTAQTAPRIKSIAVSTTPYHDAGANAVQELAIAAATGLEYVRRLLAADVDLEKACSQILFVMSVGRDFFMDIAKLRAARVLWAKIVSECGGSDSAQAMALHARTSAWTKTRRDPWVNILRSTSECFAAAVGGANSVEVAPFDGAKRRPSELALRIASNTQAILRDESHLNKVIDPAGGSWYVECLTNSLARQAWSKFQEIEANGGMTAAIQSGAIRNEVEQTARQKRESVAALRDPIIGVSEFAKVDETIDEEDDTKSTEVTAGLPDQVREHKKQYDQTGATSELNAVKHDQVGSGALTEATVAAAQAGATIGTITTIARWTNGRATSQRLSAHRASEPFEELRDAVDRFIDGGGERPKVFLASIGPIADYHARTTFAASFVGAGGMDALDSDGYVGPEEAIDAFAETSAEGAVICSSDAEYPKTVPALAAALKKRGATFVALMGQPEDMEASYRAAGVDHFIYRGCDAYQVLRSVLASLGITG